MATQVKNSDDTLNSILGFLGTFLFHAILLLLLFFMVFNTPKQLPAEQGIMVDFGNTDLGLGDFEPPQSDPAIVQNESSTSTTSEPEENLTQDFEDSFTVDDNSSSNTPTPDPTPTPTPSPTPNTNPTPNPTPNQTANPTPEQVKQVEPERTVNPQAMFPGRSDSPSNAKSQGEAGGQGNQGSPTGAPNVHVYGEGIDIGGGLEGRGIEGGLPRPKYDVNEHGVVVVTVRVDSRGNVTSATAGARGSTILNEALLNAAAKAARETKFKPDPNRVEQIGTITYTFKLKGQ